MATSFYFGEAITCHSWNEQRDQIALSLNNNFVNIYGYSGKSWELIDTLEEHELRVTSIDWCPISNKIVTCGEDRNAYVWTWYEEGWKPTLVLLRINRAAVCVRWSPKGNKFAVGSSAKLIAICHFDEENDWWVSKHIKKNIKSTVTCLDWHPNNMLIAAGSTDFKVRIYSAFIPEIDIDFPEKFGQLLGEYTNEYGGWVYSLNFSPSGTYLAWSSHDSTISLILTPLTYTNETNSQENIIVEKTSHLPFKSLYWINEKLILVAGFDCCPMVYVNKFEENKLEFLCKLGIENVSEKTHQQSAMSKFQTMDKHASSLHVETSLNTLHQNTINEIRHVMGPKSSTEVFSTIGIDGNMIMWDVSSYVDVNTDSKVENP